MTPEEMETKKQARRVSIAAEVMALANQLAAAEMRAGLVAPVSRDYVALAAPLVAAERVRLELKDLRIAVRRGGSV